MMRNLILFAAAVLMCASCGGQRTKKSPDTQGESAEKFYRMPAMPPLITDPAGQSEWAAQHFWDDFNFADTTLVGSRRDYTEQAFVDYVQLLRHVDYPLGGESLGVMFGKASADKTMFLHMAEVAEKYLFDANSPYRDDEYYILVLNRVLASPLLDEWERVRPQEQLTLSLKNRRGEPATDFRYTLGNGTTNNLYSLRADFTLLFFNNPGCPSCRETMAQIVNSAFMSRLIDEGKLKVLAIYPDQDVAAWRDYAKNFPPKWINSYDKTLVIKDKELYDLKAIPTLYLLDRNKTVMLKDVMDISLIEETIYNSMP